MYQVTCTYMSLYNVLLEVVVVFQEMNMTLFVGSQSVISLPSFMFVSAAVSEIHELNQNKRKKNSVRTFPTHIIYPFFNQRYLLITCMHSIY